MSDEEHLLQFASAYSSILELIGAAADGQHCCSEGWDNYPEHLRQLRRHGPTVATLLRRHAVHDGAEEARQYIKTVADQCAAARWFVLARPYPQQQGERAWVYNQLRELYVPLLQLMQAVKREAEQAGPGGPDPGAAADGLERQAGNKPEKEDREKKVVDLEVVPGGFALWGKKYDLTGKPRDMLMMLLQARHRCCAIDHLRELHDDSADYPQQAVKDTASKLRKALRAALQDSGFGLACDPLPSSGEGKDLSYRLDMPPRPGDSR